MDSNEIMEIISRLGGKLDDGHVSFPNGFRIKNKGDALDVLDILLFILRAIAEDGKVSIAVAHFVDILGPLEVLKGAIASGAAAKKRREKWSTKLAK